MEAQLKTDIPSSAEKIWHYSLKNFQFCFYFMVKKFFLVSDVTDIAIGGGRAGPFAPPGCAQR